MSTEIERTIQPLLDGNLSEEDREALNELLRTDAAARAEFARQMKLHALLTWRAGAASVTTPKIKPLVWRSTWQWAGWAAAAAAVVIGFSVMLLSPSPAMASVSQMMSALSQALDRTYTIRVLEGDPWFPLKVNRFANYEGAKLYLRTNTQYVLERTLDRGESSFMGSDGQINWDIRHDGPVRISRDLERFRRGLPSREQDVPFLDLSGLLSSLANGYDLETTIDAADPSLRLLRATKRSKSVNGPQEMSFAYRPETGVIMRMQLLGLPREEGGPRSLELLLTSESPLPADFFSHTAHHEPGRQVIDESASIKP
jgi:hypothetical protein